MTRDSVDERDDERTSFRSDAALSVGVLFAASAVYCVGAVLAEGGRKVARTIGRLAGREYEVRANEEDCIFPPYERIR